MINKLFTFLILMLSITVCFGQWTQLNDAPFVNDHSNGFGINGKGYVIQGYPTNNGGQFQNRLWEYDPVSDDWTVIGHAPGQGREVAIGDDMDGKYYFGFGVQRNDVWEYDPVTNEFTELPSCPCTPRPHPAFVAHNGKIYMGAGNGNFGNMNDWWVYDFATETWAQKDNIPGTGRHHPYQFGIGDVIYMGGGHVSSWYKFDTILETWSPINSFPQGRVAGSQFSYNDRGFVLTGDEADHSELTQDHFLMYFPETDEWHTLPFEQVMHRWAPTSFIIDNFLYFFGGIGYVAGGDDANMWKFDLSSVDCLAPDVSYAANIEENSAFLIWNNSPTGDTDTLQWREVGTADWNTIANPQSTYVLEDLTSCTTYEFRVNSNCDPGSTYTDPATFRTKGCGNCLDLEYCDVSNEYLSLTNYINKVTIGNYENESGDDGGYQEFNSSSNVEIALGGTFELEIEPGFDNATDDYRCKVWFDLNGDGNFSQSERLVNVANVTGTLVQTVTVPTTGLLGPTRMRIGLDVNFVVEACDGSGDGEMEDYCISLVDEITSVDDLIKDKDISIYPNPSSGILDIQNSNNDPFILNVYETTGKLIFSEENPESINLEYLAEGLYFVDIENTNTQKKTTEKLIIKK